MASFYSVGKTLIRQWPVRETLVSLEMGVILNNNSREKS